MMKAGAIAIALACWLTTPVTADQHDPSLSALFGALASSHTPREAARIEAAIRAIWLQSGDPAIDEMLASGMRAIEERDIDVALEVLDEVVARAPYFAEGFNQRATALFLARDYDASLADIERVLVLEPRHFGALSGRGLIHLARGAYYLALVDFQAVLAIDPFDMEARRYVILLRHRLGAETV